MWDHSASILTHSALPNCSPENSTSWKPLRSKQLIMLISIIGSQTLNVTLGLLPNRLGPFLSWTLQPSRWVMREKKYTAIVKVWLTPRIYHRVLPKTHRGLKPPSLKLICPWEALKHLISWQPLSCEWFPNCISQTSLTSWLSCNQDEIQSRRELWLWRASSPKDCWCRLERRGWCPKMRQLLLLKESRADIFSGACPLLQWTWKPSRATLQGAGPGLPAAGALWLGTLQGTRATLT